MHVERLTVHVLCVETAREEIQIDKREDERSNAQRTSLTRSDYVTNLKISLITDLDPARLLVEESMTSMNDANEVAEVLACLSAPLDPNKDKQFLSGYSLFRHQNFWIGTYGTYSRAVRAVSPDKACKCL